MGPLNLLKSLVLSFFISILCSIRELEKLLPLWSEYQVFTKEFLVKLSEAYLCDSA
jgi:hypothetical protein